MSTPAPLRPPLLAWGVLCVFLALVGYMVGGDSVGVLFLVLWLGGFLIAIALTA